MSYTNHCVWDSEKENRLDPDDANTWTCSACLVPIFATPFKTIDQDGVTHRVHDQCTDEALSPRLERHPLHPKGDLVLCHQEYSSPHSCSRCKSKCGGTFYGCGCGFSLCLVCARVVKVLHRSHEHRLMGIRRRTHLSFLCNICGTQHPPPTGPGEEMVLQMYECADCDFSIHPDCALLPNAIIIKARHPHPLLLGYHKLIYWRLECDICQCAFSKSEYKYACCCCPGFYRAHVKCAIYSQPPTFNKVSTREIEGLLRLPMEDENKSVILSTAESHGKYNSDYTISNTSSDDDTDDDKLLSFHEHPLKLYHHQDGKDIPHVCNTCIQLIGPFDPFYGCANGADGDGGRCKDYFLHNYCANLSKTFPMVLLSELSNMSFNIFMCQFCKCMCNGPGLAIKDGYIIDVMCAIMEFPIWITHIAHGKTHILQRSKASERYNICNCCREKVDDTRYMLSCITCHGFSIHRHCVLHPATVSHNFDPHPLKLITDTGEDGDGHHHHQEEEITLLCEICEEDIDKRIWRYGCDKCNQSFHPRCIPCRDHLSKIKFGFPIHVSCHSCPVACVRAHAVDGYLCGHCGRAIRESDGIAFECSECYFRMHKGCVEEQIIKTTSYN